MYRAIIVVTLRSSILDPQGKAVVHALDAFGMKEVGDVRIGKSIEMKIDTDDKSRAQRIVEEACRKLLANPVLEDFTFTLEHVTQP